MIGNKFITNHHHEVINKELVKVAKYETEYLIINIPPRHGKTVMAAVLFIAWSLARNPKARFLYITASDILRNITSKQIRDIVTSQLFIAFWDVNLQQDSSAKNNWLTEQGGGVATATIGGQITGLGAGIKKEFWETDKFGVPIFDGAIIIDDPNKIRDSLSENLHHSNVAETYLSTIRSRKNTKYTPTILIMQRTGFNDLTEIMIDFHNKKKIDNKLVHLVMPALNDDGSALWESEMGIAEIEEIKLNPETAAIFSTQYMQEPASKDAFLFNIQELNLFKKHEFLDNLDSHSICYIDTADGGIDYYCAIFGVFVNQKLYILDVIFNKGIKLGINKEVTKGKMIKYKTQNCEIETNKEGSAFVEPFSEEMPNVMFYSKFNSVNKITRMVVQQAFILQNFYFRSDYKINSDYDKFMVQLTRFSPAGKNKNDDAPDATAGLSNFIRENFMYTKSLTKENTGLF